MQGTIKLALLRRARDYGYVIWAKSQDEEMKGLLNGLKKVHLVFKGNDLGEKNIDWRYKRISVGYKWTRRLVGDSSVFVLRREEPNILRVDCK